MNEEKRARSTTTDGRPPAPGLEESAAPQPIGSSGQHEAYWVLSEAERSKGFVRPVRSSYRHVGPAGPGHGLRDLTEEERKRYGDDYVKFELYPSTESPVTGRFWTQGQLDQVAAGCGSVTSMGQALSETWARDPSYYGSTFCCTCAKHLPVDEFRWEHDGAVLGA